jgi:uncharacterized protein (TIGR03437 family)
MRIVGLALILFGSLAWSQPLPAGRAQDLDFIANQVPKLHVNFFFQLNPADYQAAVARLQANGAAMTNAEFYVGLASLLALAGDAHTTIYLFQNTAAGAGFQNFPLTFRWLDDGVFVVGAAAPYARALGTRLVAVGAYAMDEVEKRLAAMIPHANNQWLHFEGAQYLSVQQVLQGLDLAPAAATTPLTFQTGAGEHFTLDVAPASGAQAVAPDPGQGTTPDYLQSTSRNYWFRYSAANRLLYLKYNVCEDDPANPMAQFSAAFLSALDANPVDTVVFDFRGNTGGNSAVIVPLATGLVQRLPSLAANPNFRFYDVIDKGTFSSGMDNAIQLKAPIPPEFGVSIDLPHLTTVIGEGTGGPTDEYGEVLSFRLPSSGIPGQYSTRHFPPPDGIAAANSFLPDIAVSTRSTDYFARHDPVMAAMLGRSGNAPPAPAGDAIVVNGASFRTDQGVAPGSLAAVFGSFTASPDQVAIDGETTAVIAGNAFQADFLVPADAAAGTRNVSVRAAGKELAAGKVTISAAGPGIFVLNGGDPAQPGAIENQDYAVNTAGNPAPAGSVIQIFATGAAPSESAPQVKVYLGGTPADVLYSGPSGFPGLWQINATVPGGASGQVPLFVTAHNFTSNGVTVWVK